MIVLGVTGGIGSGKSEVCRLLAREGARVFYADNIAREIMTNDAGVKDRLMDAFGPQSYDPNGDLNRTYLAERVFSSEKDRERMNSIVHPAVGAAFKRFLREANEDGAALLVKEAALLFENDTSDLDYIVVVDAPKMARVARIAARDGMSPEAIESRINSQMSASEMRARADYVIYNHGSLEELRVSVGELLTALNSLKTQGSSPGSPIT